MKKKPPFEIGCSIDNNPVFESHNPHLIDTPRANRSIRRGKDKKNRKETPKKRALALWDIENVNFADDYKIVAKHIDDSETVKIVVGKEPKRYPRDHRLHNEAVYHRLKNRNWDIDKAKKKVDERLMGYYHKHKHGLEKLILISGDSDFKPIVEDAEKAGIEVLILNKDKRDLWFKEHNYINLLGEQR